MTDRISTAIKDYADGHITIDDLRAAIENAPDRPTDADLEVSRLRRELADLRKDMEREHRIRDAINRIMRA